jgi:hypothetical protein
MDSRGPRKYNLASPTGWKGWTETRKGCQERKMRLAIITSLNLAQHFKLVSHRGLKPTVASRRHSIQISFHPLSGWCKWRVVHPALARAPRKGRHQREATWQGTMPERESHLEWDDARGHLEYSFEVK